jgi:Ca2+:H+ antiporter
LFTLLFPAPLVPPAVGAIDGSSRSLGLPVLFSATILLPIVGNAAEHFSAILFARKNQMDISLGIAVGSSTQIALFVIPLMVLLGWMASQPLSLDFQIFETVCLLLTVMITSIVLSTGKSDYLYGVLMVVAYFIISAAFWLQKQPDNLD